MFNRPDTSSEATKKFHIGDVLSIVTGQQYSPEGMSGIYKILNFMTGDSLFTHQLPRAKDECTPYLLKQYPDLANIVPQDRKEDKKEWLQKQIAQFGEYLVISKLPPKVHQEIGPLDEFLSMKRSSTAQNK